MDKLMRRDPDAPPKKVDPATAVRMQRDGAVLLDVRERQEWALGRAAKARHIPLGQLSTRTRELSSTATILTICRTGARSSRAASLLRSHGFTAVNVSGGMRAWQAAGLPVVANGGKPGRVG
jgi:rhodanese-related sulfurtransferase